ncbi:hypothetical protein QQ045_003468 [Rhodiola kirilowii]
MGRRPCCEKEGLNKGAWTAVEDRRLVEYVEAHGEGKWGNVPKAAGLKRCGKSCRLRWLNYLRPDIKRGNISPDEEDLIVRLHRLLGNRWSLIAGRLPGRTDNEIKNYWNTTLSKKLISLNNIVVVNKQPAEEHQQPPFLAVSPPKSTRAAVMAEKSSLEGKAAADHEMKSSSYSTSRFNTKSSNEEDSIWNFNVDELEMEFNLGDFAELGNISSTNYVNNDDIAGGGTNSRNTDDENINFGPILECNLIGDKDHHHYHESDDFPFFASLFDRRSVADEDHWLLNGDGSNMFGSV